MNIELLKELLGVERLDLIMLNNVEEYASLMREKRHRTRRRRCCYWGGGIAGFTMLLLIWVVLRRAGLVLDDALIDVML